MIITLAQIEVFLLVLARIAGIFITAPLFKLRSLPASIKIAIAIWMATVLWFVVPLSSLALTLPAFIIALVIEIIIGALIGLVCDLIFVAIKAGGDIMEHQMGLIRQTVDPITGGPGGMVGQLAFLIGILTFLAIDGHHLILSALHQSFQALPLGMPIDLSSGKFTYQLMVLGKNLWLTAIQFAAPVVLLVFLSDFSFGIVSRVAPQVNVFMLGFQVKPSLGFIGFLFCMPLFVRHVVYLIGKMTPEIINLFANLK